MATAAQNQLYPLATQDGKFIPFDVVQARALMIIDLDEDFQPIVLDEMYNLSVIFSEAIAILDFTNGVVTVPLTGVSYPDWQFVPSGFAVLSVLPTATIRIRNITGAGKMFIQGVQKWSTLALPRQIAAKVS